MKPQKVLPFSSKTIKDEHLLHNYKPQTEIIVNEK